MFKAYAEKSKANRGLSAYGELALAAKDKLVHIGRDEKTGEDKWGFLTEQAEAARDGKDWTTHDSAELKAAEGKPDEATQAAVVMVAAAPIEPGAAVAVTAEGMVAPLTDAEAKGAASTWEEVAARNPGAGVFGTMAARVQDSRPAATTNARRARDAAYTIEKNRPEQNGIKRPSEGGKCRTIWNALTEQFEKTGEVPTLADTKEALRELDKTTVAVQYYRWRKFNGITGRQVKAEEAAPTEEKAAGPTLSEKIGNVVKE